MDAASIKEHSQVWQKYRAVRDRWQTAATKSQIAQFIQSITNSLSNTGAEATLAQTEGAADNTKTLQTLLYRSVMRGQDIVVGSQIYQWLTEEPEQGAIVIDLRKTRTVGPVLRYLDRMTAAIIRAQSHSATLNLVRKLQAYIR